MMDSLFLFVLALLLTLSCCGSIAVAQTPVYLHTVYVDNTNPNASDTVWCGSNTSSPCRDLAYVLTNKVENYTQVVIASGGRYSLEDSVNISSRSSVAIRISHKERVNVTCRSGAGLTFVKCFNVELYGLTLLGCSALQESTSRNFSSSEFSFMKFPVALYFLSCKNINLTSITISDSSGTGLAVIATGGQNYFQDCTLTNNGSPDNSTYPSGGGMYIEFPFCSPHNPANCERQNYTEDVFITGAKYEITNTNFEGNTAHMWHPISYLYLLPQPTNHLSFGNGGGLSVFFSRTTGSVVTVTDCLFQSNTAEWGAGAAIEFQSMSWNNTFVMESCVLVNNTIATNLPQGIHRGGGGLKLRYTANPQDRPLMANNNMTFINCTFVNNIGIWGGGVLLRAVREPRLNATNTLKFINCSWIENLGRVGSAMELAVWAPTLSGACLTPRFTNCIFRGNDDIFFNIISPLGHAISVGSVYTHSIPLLFETSVVFEKNNRSALAAVNTVVEFSENSCADFLNNTGKNGGAIALYGSAFLLVSNNTSMTFIGNTANKFGGAIYHSAEGEHEIYLFGYCFIQYTDFTTPPWNWTSTFYFSRNNAKFKEGGDSIYAISLIPCLWDYTLPNSQHIIPDSRAEVFCWSEGGWIYENQNCTEQVSSAPGEFNSTTYHMKIVLGKRQRMPIVTFEDKGKDQTSNAIFNLWSHSEGVAQIPAQYTYVSDNTIALTGTPNSNATLAVETIAPRTVYTEIRVEILPCPPGFIAEFTNNSQSSCVCDKRYGSILQCNQGSFTAKLRRGLWMGKDKFHQEPVVGMYPYTRNSLKEVYFELASNITALDHQLCSNADRTGPFCAQCKHGYAPSINSLTPHCVPCPNKKAYFYWMLYILVEVVPVTIFLFAIMLFHISVTRGAFNSFVLFAQLITTTFDITGDGTIPLHTITSSASGLQKAYHVVYNFWNLNFFISISSDFCLSPKLDTITVLSFHYLLAFYSLALIFVFYCLVRLYEHGIQPFYFLGKPIHHLLRFFRRRWNLSRSTVDAFSTFLVLSSTKFTIASVYLLTPVTYVSSNGTEMGSLLYFQGDVTYLSKKHAPFFVLAVFVMVTFVLLPTLLLLVYPLRLVEWLAARLGYCGRLLRPGHRMNLFLDSFQGCFKDGTNGTRDYRYFAGVYFLLRTILFTTYAYTGIWLQQYAVQQLVCTVAILLITIIRPYKKEFYNNLDATILGILALVNALSMYNIYYTSQGFSLSSWAFALQYTLIYCPLIYLICYITWKLVKHKRRKILRFICKCFGCNYSERQTLLSNVLNDGDSRGGSTTDEEYRQFADEVEAFGRDRERNRYRPKRTDSSGSDDEESGKGTSTAPLSSGCTMEYNNGSSTSGVSSGLLSDP